MGLLSARTGSSTRFWLGGIVAVLAAIGSASAEVRVDQEQPTTTVTPSAIGGTSEQVLAQSFTAGTSGDLVAIRLPVACSSGTLVVQIQSLNSDGEPSGRILASAMVPASDLPPPPSDFREITFDPPFAQREGERYAIVLKNIEGTCSILSGPSGDSYTGGQFFYDARPNPPGWVGGKDRPAPRSTPGDMPFQTVVDDGSPGGSRPDNRCVLNTASGPVRPGFDIYTPICSCLTDRVLNEWRCALLHPDFFMVRRIPLPTPNAAPNLIAEEWAFTPLSDKAPPLVMSIPGPEPGKYFTHAFGKKSKRGSFEYFAINRDLKRGLMAPGGVEFVYGEKDNALRFGFDPTYTVSDQRRLDVPPAYQGYEKAK